MTTWTEAVVTAALAAAQDRGVLGPGSVGQHVAHAREFARALKETTGIVDPEAVLDLGSGSGLPGTGARAGMATLPHSAPRLLRPTIGTAGGGGRYLRVRGAGLRLLRTSGDRRARARIPGRRSAVVVARMFGPPAVTSECASPFLKVGGALVVSTAPTEDGLDSEVAADQVERAGDGPRSSVARRVGLRHPATGNALPRAVPAARRGPPEAAALLSEAGLAVTLPGSRVPPAFGHTGPSWR